MNKVTVLGSFMQDVTVYAPEFPVDGQTLFGSRVNIGPGGKGSNQATASAFFGAETVLIAKIGRDTFGENAMKHFQSAGIKTDYVSVSDDKATGMASITVNEVKGENRIVIVPGANQAITKEEVDRAETVIRASDVLLLQYENNQEAIGEFLRLGKKYGKTIIINPAPIADMPAEFYEGTDYVTPNETEAAVLAGMDAVETMDDVRLAAKKILAKGCKAVIITLGKNGSYFTDGVREIKMDPIPVKAVDTTGAGDTFNGGFAAALAAGFDTETALKYATTMSAIAVTRPGSASSVPNREETEKWFHEYF